jgi:hypothetical protein
MLAYTFGTLLVTIAIVAWIACWVGGAVDVFRRTDLSGGAKVLWLCVLILIPFLGLFVYYLARAASPATR